MSTLLTILILVLVAATTGLVTWEVTHRRSRLVRLWNPSSFPGRVKGGLGMLEGGSVSDRLAETEPEAIVLLHGLGATADFFGDVYEGLAIRHRLVMPDLLGFGRSLDERRSDFSLEAHVDALDAAITSLALGNARLVLAAHSMGSAVALEYSRRRPERIVRVVLWGPPVYPDEAAAREIGAEYGGMANLLLLDKEWAGRLCELSCRHRRASGWLMAMSTPRWPTDVSRRAVMHTWPAFRQSLDELVLQADWAELFDTDVPTTVFCGSDDSVGDRGYLESVAPKATIVDVPGADHHLALTHPHLLFDLLEP